MAPEVAYREPVRNPESVRFPGKPGWLPAGARGPDCFFQPPSLPEAARRMAGFAGDSMVAALLAATTRP